MPLHKIKDFDPDYRNHFDNNDVIGLDLYSGTDKIGTVDDVLVDDQGEFRYLVVSTGAWIFGKKVLLPIGSARIDSSSRRVFAKNLSKAQVEQLPEFVGNPAAIDYDHEEQVRGVYRAPAAAKTNYDRDNYRYQNDADLYNLNDQDHQSLRLYQERLIASKTRQKVGEVAVGKRVETETAQVSVPIEKERVVIERTSVSGTGATVAPGEAFHEGEVARVEVYEETPNIQKEAFVREEVRVQKVVDQETVTSQDQVRREELDIDTQGRPVIDNDDRSTTRKNV